MGHDRGPESGIRTQTLLQRFKPAAAAVCEGFVLPGYDAFLAPNNPSFLQPLTTIPTPHDPHPQVFLPGKWHLVVHPSGAGDKLPMDGMAAKK